MAWDYDQDDLWNLIDDIDATDADVWLVCALLELAVESLVDAGELHTEVGAAVAGVVRTLHDCASQLAAEAEKEASDIRDLLSAQQHARARIADAADGLRRAWPSSPAQRAARELALAACLAAADEVGRAVNHAEAAVEAGATDGVAYLALGYLRYRQALDTFAPVDKLDDRGKLRFQLACLRAVSALEQGLGGDVDVHLHWYIALALEAAGFTEAAADAWRRYEAAARADEEGDDLVVEEDMPNQYLPQISPDEERQVSDALKNMRSIDELLGGSDEAPPASEDS